MYLFKDDGKVEWIQFITSLQFLYNVNSINIRLGTSLVAQWLRIRLPMQGTQVRALVWEDPTCCRATKPVHHNY